MEAVRPGSEVLQAQRSEDINLQLIRRMGESRSWLVLGSRPLSLVSQTDSLRGPHVSCLLARQTHSVPSGLEGRECQGGVPLGEQPSAPSPTERGGRAGEALVVAEGSHLSCAD